MVNELIAANTGVIFKKDAFLDMPAFNAVLTRRRFPIRALTVIPERTTLETTTLPTYTDYLTNSPRESIHQAVIAQEKLSALRQDSEDKVADATAPMFDQLRERPGWWILEFLPVYTYKQDEEGKWHKTLKWNRGRPREISSPNPVFHSSVLLRQTRGPDGYRPRAKWKGTPVYTD